MSYPKSTLAIAALMSLFAAQTASATDISPRVGVSGVWWNTGEKGEGAVGGGAHAGTTITFDQAFLDLNVETMQFSVRKPTNTGLATDQTAGWRSEASVAAGIPVWNTFSVFGGYRLVNYGTDIGSSNAATMSGVFAGVALSSLSMPGDDKNLFSIAFAIQPTEFKAKNGNAETDVGVSIKLGYRRAGSPHGMAIRYQSFGGDKTYSEYSTTLQYSYSF